jgi:hypothetical protein
MIWTFYFGVEVRILVMYTFCDQDKSTLSGHFLKHSTMTSDERESAQYLVRAFTFMLFRTLCNEIARRSELQLL